MAYILMREGWRSKGSVYKHVGVEHRFPAGTASAAQANSWPAGGVWRRSRLPHRGQVGGRGVLGVSYVETSPVGNSLQFTEQPPACAEKNALSSTVSTAEAEKPRSRGTETRGQQRTAGSVQTALLMVSTQVRGTGQGSDERGHTRTTESKPFKTLRFLKSHSPLCC